MERPSNQRTRDRRRGVWIASFGIATVLGFANAFQLWLMRGGKPPFWSSRFIPPQLIPWLAWAAIVPLLFSVFHRISVKNAPRAERIALYGATGAAAIATQVLLTALALGWWWAFPSLIPMDPLWHVRDQLRTRTVLGILVFALVVAVYHLRRTPPELQKTPAVSEDEPRATEQTPAVISLKVGDRILLVEPSQIDFVEADRDHIVVHCASARHRVRQTITAMERRLPASHVRISRSAIVNLQSVAEIQPWFRGDLVVILKNGVRATTGAKYRERLTTRI